MINSKFKESLSELEKFKNQAIFILEYKKRNYPKVLHWSAKLIVLDSDIDEPVKSLDQSISTKIKTSAIGNWIINEATVKHNIKISECWYNQKQITWKNENSN